ncbi:DUF2480 family protein [Aquimarina muelleri]|uniref:DUF2480 family protein n=1 Tax=Aquimarina muelleri TaxID=279356 RepID=A0A918JVB5_9FLAO|nr:DUF2480 family protein [Aquimarina muelleri]MCX2763224.1 DUF2480 family protein [Aquimarina muelleri]GGX20058.1 hypothetical protein GCM10007384_21820 [Aquimarina muelleri]
MAEEIVNKVASNINLITFDLEEYYPKGNRILFDIKDWLYEGLILREKDFRKQVMDHDWSQYQDAYLALTCSTDAIIPGWAYLLVTSAAFPFVKKVVVGSLETIETLLYNEIIRNLDISKYQDKFIIIKGCANKPVPQGAYIALIQKLQPVAKSLMYGEACSSVPLYKRK